MLELRPWPVWDTSSRLTLAHERGHEAVSLPLSAADGRKRPAWTRYLSCLGLSRCVTVRGWKRPLTAPGPLGPGARDTVAQAGDTVAQAGSLGKEPSGH